MDVGGLLFSEDFLLVTTPNYTVTCSSTDMPVHVCLLIAHTYIKYQAMYYDVIMPTSVYSTQYSTLETCPNFGAVNNIL